MRPRQARNSKHKAHRDTEAISHHLTNKRAHTENMRIENEQFQFNTTLAARVLR